MNRYDYVIFDFDGTVVDTGEGILKSLQYAFQKMGDPVPTLEDLKRFIGPPLFYSFGAFYNIPQEMIPVYIEKYRERYKVIGIYECELYENMRELLEKLKSAGIKIGIASSKPEFLIYDVMKHLKIENLFDAVTGTTGDDTNHSSKTDLILSSLKKMGAIDKSRALMVGDRCYDIDGATGAGIDSCGVLFGYGSEEEFKEHGATHIVSNAEEILDIVL